MAIIYLTQGKQTIIDDDDLNRVSRHKWYYNERYAKTRIGKKKVYLHKFIANDYTSDITDHIDGDTLNNRKSNLRKCSAKENTWNRRSKNNTTSKYKGVSWRKVTQTWQVHIMHNGISIKFQSFKCEIEAAKEYNKLAIKYHGEFARLNEI